MRVGVNLSWLVPGVVGGSEESLTRSLAALAQRTPPDMEVVLFVPPALREAHPRLVDTFETHDVPLAGRVKPLRVAAEHTALPLLVRSKGIDVVHDAGGTSPGRVDRPRVLTIHDIQPLDVPGNFSPVKVAYLRWAVPRAVSGADHVMVPSTFVRDRLVDRLGADPDRISVVPWPVPAPIDEAPIETIRATYGIIGDIVLVPAITYPHKDHVTAIRAFRHLAERHKETTMVLTGGEGPAEQKVLAEIEETGLAERFVRTGRVSEPVVRSLFTHARAVVFPSRYEGFGVPALEAMAAGVPVVVADAGALPEVVGDAGAVVPVGDDAQLAVELHRILGDPDHHDALAAAGRDRAGQFGPERTADGMIAAYRSALVSL